MESAIAILKVAHILTAILMAWPFYALVAVNQRVRLGPPLGDRTDTFMENIIKNRTIPCFVFQGTALVTGIALMWARGLGLDSLAANPVLGAKFILLLLIAGLLAYVHISLQPRLDSLFAKARGNSVAPDMAPQITALRGRRKRLASICLFAVLLMAMLGVQVWVAFPLWLTGALTAAIAAFTWRAYSSQMVYGWA